MEGGTNWQSGSAYYDSQEKHSGKTSLQIDDSNAQSSQDVDVVYSNVWTPIDNTVATQYTYSAWVLSKGNALPRLALITDSVNALPSPITTSVKNQWVRIEGTFLVPANVKKISLQLAIYGLGNVWFDDVLIRKTANAPLVNKLIPDVDYKDRQLVIDYNTFKSPVNINEAGVDKLSFVYNDNNDRSVMFYGSLDATKTLRPLRKHYSADGSMEIKQNILTGAIEFITYLAGDGYTAPVVYKQNHSNATSDGVGGLLYLHRDYQGSILAITNDAGVILEKRQFDAWGSLIQLEQNGELTSIPSGGAGLSLLLDRGYTGHEHLLSVGLINMNGRLYDPKLHRFLQPDNFVQEPYNTQNYNRYGYVLNNPLKYTDPSGEKWKITWSDIVSGVAIVAGIILSATGLAVIGAPLIAAGVNHFVQTINEYKTTGDWVTASNNAGFVISFTTKTDFGYDSPKSDVYGVEQNQTKGSSGPANEAVHDQIAKDRAQSIYYKEISEQDNNYNFFYKNRDRDLRFSAEYLADGDPSYNTIVMNMHGSDKHYLSTPVGKMYPKDLHRFLLKYNITYKDSYKNGTPITVRLEACYAGRQFAGEFSTYNKNMIVVGPSDAIMNVMIYNYVINGGSYFYYENGIQLNVNPQKK